MEKNALTITVGILLILYALINLGAAFGEYTKAEFVSGTASTASELGRMAGDYYGASKIRNQGNKISLVFYLIAFFIFATSVLDFVASVGIFSGASWASGVLIVAAFCGILVEIQDIVEDGFGPPKILFLLLNILALSTGFWGRQDSLETTN